MIGVLILTITALILGIIIELVGKLLEEEKSIYLDYLPGYNCGSCGFGSCEGMSKAMEKDPMNYKKCRPMRDEQKKIMEEFLERSGKI